MNIYLAEAAARMIEGAGECISSLGDMIIDDVELREFVTIPMRIARVRDNIVKLETAIAAIEAVIQIGDT